VTASEPSHTDGLATTTYTISGRYYDRQFWPRGAAVLRQSAGTLRHFRRGRVAAVSRYLAAFSTWLSAAAIRTARYA